MVLLGVWLIICTAPDNETVENSPIYQNPYWPIVPDMPAEK